MRVTRGERMFRWTSTGILIFLGISCLLPLLQVTSVSLSSARAVSSGWVGIVPQGFTFESYSLLLKGTPVFRALGNSAQITLIGVLLSLLFTIMAAYPLSRNYFFARRWFTLGIVFTMIFNAGLIPTFLVVKNLGLVNSYGAIWGLGLVNTFNMLVMKTYFEGLPEEIMEAARIDGCSEVRLLAQIVLPLSMPSVATIALFYAVSYWNAFMQIIVYIQDTNKYNLTVLIQQMIQSQQLMTEIGNLYSDEATRTTPDGIKAAGIIVMMLPMLAIYPFLQRFFVKGVMIGSIKG